MPMRGRFTPLGYPVRRAAQAACAAERRADPCPRTLTAAPRRLSFEAHHRRQSSMRRFAILLLVGAPLAAQASFLPFGTGCTFQGQTPAIGNQGLPQLGTTLQITYSGPNFTFSSGQQIAQPFLVLGLGQQNTVIPGGLLPQQPPGCQGFITQDAVFPMGPDPNGRPSFANFLDLPVPNNPALIGFVFFAQWLTLVQQCGFAGC